MNSVDMNFWDLFIFIDSK